MREKDTVYHNIYELDASVSRKIKSLAADLDQSTQLVILDMYPEEVTDCFCFEAFKIPMEMIGLVSVITANSDQAVIGIPRAENDNLSIDTVVAYIGSLGKLPSVSY